MPHNKSKFIYKYCWKHYVKWESLDKSSLTSCIHFLSVAITNDHKLSSLNQHTLPISQFWVRSPTDLIEIKSRCLGVLGENLLPWPLQFLEAPTVWALGLLSPPSNQQWYISLSILLWSHLPMTISKKGSSIVRVIFDSSWLSEYSPYLKIHPNLFTSSKPFLAYKEM